MIWHPAKWWIQEIPGLINPIEGRGNLFIWPDEESPQLYSEPPGLLDSGRYWVDPDTGEALAPLYFKCLTCCCTPAKCNIPHEILMTVSGFEGTLSSIDRPSAYGHGPGNVCPACSSILWTGSAEAGPGHRWTGYTAECCTCRQGESFYWWPRNIVGSNADGGPICGTDRYICNAFPHLCSPPAEPVTKRGRIAARYINPCPWPCTYFTWADDPIDGSGKGYSLVELTDCAQAPDANARQDYNCITTPREEFVRAADSYLWPPGFKGPGAVNLLPLCDNKFWNDTTYYRFCVKGGFWCQIPDWYNHCYCDGGFYGRGDFFDGLYESTVRDNAWRTSSWCEESPNRCQGPVPVNRVGWEYSRPQYVLISQPSRQQCALCPGYGFGYGSDFSNYGRGQDWYDPYDDGNCIGKTDVDMADFNQTFMLYAEVINSPPYLQAVVSRNRVKPACELKLINAQLLYQVKRYVQNEPFCTCFQYDQGYWNLDYPCEPKAYDFECGCTICAPGVGIVAPRLQAFYLGQVNPETGKTETPGADALIKFKLRNFCSPASLSAYGAQYSGFWWYVAEAWIDEKQRGVYYKVGDEFLFSYSENPLRGGEALQPSRYGEWFQKIRVTAVGEEGEILEVALIGAAYSDGKAVKLCDWIPILGPSVPVYGRFLAHRYAVGAPGNGYVEGDEFVFEPFSGPPQGSLPTGNKYYPYVPANGRYKKRARAIVLEVDSRGGVVDWYMCGAKNNFAPDLRTEADITCEEDNTGIYYADLQYANRCQYSYAGVTPVKYAWSGWLDYHFHGGTYCEHAWAEFNFNIDQISVKNTVIVQPPPVIPGIKGRKAKLRIKTVGAMSVSNQTIDPLKYQNYEISPGPSDTTTRYVNGAEGVAAWFKNHEIPVPQGAVLSIEVVDPGSGYVKKVVDGVDPITGAELYHWEPLEVSTDVALFGNATAGWPGIVVRGVADDIRLYAYSKWGWPSFCSCEAQITKLAIANEQDNDFGGISSVSVLHGGLWYFAHEYEHLWFARCGTNWYFELADPISEDNPQPRDIDYSDINGAPCWHAARDNWGELHHYDGFFEPYPSGYYSAQHTINEYDWLGMPAGTRPYTSYTCGVKVDGADNYEWPVSERRIGTPPPGSDIRRRWSLQYCPNELFERDYRMILIHPCAACAKELNIPGGQTCWNMRGFGDTTYAMAPNQWGGTGTAMVTKLGGNLSCTISLPEPE